MSFQAPTLPSDFSAVLAQFKSEKFKELWPAQADVLSRYSEYLTQSDLGIDLRREQEKP